jgi:flagellar capping protein FliD
MVTNSDLQKIAATLQPQFKKIDEGFNRLDKRFDKLDTRLNKMEKKLHKRLNRLEARTQKYTQDASDTIIATIEDLLQQHAQGDVYPHHLSH